MELLTWGLPIFAALALFALCYSLLEITSRSADHQMAKVWFGVGTLILVARVVYWAVTSPQNFWLRLIVCSAVCLVLGVITIEAIRSINHKRTLWLDSNQNPNVKVRQLEEKQRLEKPQLTVTDEERRLLKQVGDSMGLGTPTRANKELEIARRLNDYMEQGEALLRKVAHDTNAVGSSIVWWETEVRTYLEESLGEFAAIDFIKSYPETPYPHAAVNRHMVNRLYTQLQRLGKLIEDQRKG
jgi:hypothetical protein